MIRNNNCLHTHNIRMFEIDNVHKHIGIRNTWHSRNWFRYETFYYLWVKGNSTWGERDTIFQCWLFHLPQTTCGPRRKLLVWPRRVLKVNLLLPRQKLNSLLFLKSPNPQPTLQMRDVTHIPWFQFLSGIFILTSLNDTSSPRAREHQR